MIAGLLDRLAELASPWGYVLVGVLAPLKASVMQRPLLLAQGEGALDLEPRAPPSVAVVD